MPLFDEPVHVGRPNVGSITDFEALTRDMFDRNWLSNSGPLVTRLEAELAKFLDVRHCIAISNGTIALEIAIRATGLTGEVIVPSYTFVATAHALEWLGIKPVFADVDPRTHNLDPDSVRSLITPQTSGIIGVHLWGRPALVDELAKIANDHGIHLLFDAAHAFGNDLNGTKIGNFGDAEVLSFHATKFFNTFEGGAITTNDDALAQRVRDMRNFGFAGYDNVIARGTNGKMTEISAAMGLVNLASIEQFVQRNRENYAAYQRAFESSPDIALLDLDHGLSWNYQYVVIELASNKVHLRDALIAALHAENVLARRYFWPGCHNMEPYRTQDPEANLRLPNTTVVADRVVVLPTGMAVEPADCGSIGSFIVEWLDTQN